MGRWRYLLHYKFARLSIWNQAAEVNIFLQRGIEECGLCRLGGKG